MVPVEPDTTGSGTRASRAVAFLLCASRKEESVFAVVGLVRLSELDAIKAP